MAVLAPMVFLLCSLYILAHPLSVLYPTEVEEEEVVDDFDEVDVIIIPIEDYDRSEDCD